MLESLLVADHGLGAARVLLTCRRLGIKSVLAGLSTPDVTPTDATHLADDVVLLSDVAELADPVAVVRAAQAAGVQAIHPGYGPLRADPRLADAAAQAALFAVVTSGIGTPDRVAAALSAQDVPMTPSAVPSRWVYLFGVQGRISVLGSARVSADGLLVAGDDDTSPPRGDENFPARGDAHRLAHAAAAVLGVDGAAAVAVGADGVVDIVAGLPESHAVWELVTDLDLVELQLDPSSVAELDVTTGGVAVGRMTADTVEDARGLDDLSAAADAGGGGLRLDAVSLAGSPHGALVRASAWAEDESGARSFLARYDERAGRPA